MSNEASEGESNFKPFQNESEAWIVLEVLVRVKQYVVAKLRNKIENII